MGKLSRSEACEKYLGAEAPLKQRSVSLFVARGYGGEYVQTYVTVGRLIVCSFARTVGVSIAVLVVGS